MAYINGFVVPVPTANRDAYVNFAARMWPLFRKFGAIRMVEAWGDSVPDGVHTSFPLAVKLEPGETVVFSWIEWPDRDSAARCHASVETDPDWIAAGGMGEMPFDGKRMIWGDFVPMIDLHRDRD